MFGSLSLATMWIIQGSVFSADIFCAEIFAEKSQRFNKITTAVGKSKHEFWCTGLFITVK
jgi:hypothetical protein